jgi:hypothetical protein
MPRESAGRKDSPSPEPLAATRPRRRIATRAPLARPEERGSTRGSARRPRFAMTVSRDQLPSAQRRSARTTSTAPST